jgi:hypothetical protein
MVVFIGLVISDDWIRMHNRKLQQQAMRYERASWNSVFCCLNDGMCAASDAASRETKLKDFNMSFEELIHPGLNHTFDIYIVFMFNYFSVGDDVLIDSETFLVTDFVNLKIKPT